jgi:hypothetical protein
MLYPFWNYFIFLVLVIQKPLKSSSHFTLQIDSILHDGLRWSQLIMNIEILLYLKPHAIFTFLQL